MIKLEWEWLKDQPSLQLINIETSYKEMQFKKNLTMRATISSGEVEDYLAQEMMTLFKMEVVLLQLL